MSFNVKVTDVLPARIRALRSKDQGWQNVGAGRRGNSASHDLADRNPVGGAQSPPELLPVVKRRLPYPIMPLLLMFYNHFWFFFIFIHFAQNEPPNAMDGVGR